MGAASSLTSPSYQAMLSTCRGPELRDANRRQSCEAVASLMSEHSDTIEEPLVGAHLRVALGAPQSHLDEMRGTYYAFADHYDLGMLSSEGAPLDCSSMRRNLRRLAQLAAVGEAKTAR